MNLKKYPYYFRSIIQLITNVRPLPTILRIFMNPGAAAKRSEETDIRLPKHGVSFKVRGAMDIWSVKETFLDRFYERFGTPLGAGWTVVDIGGGIGDFTTFAARAHASNTVFAFEPTPSSFKLLQENLNRNHASNASGYPLAIWSEDSSIWMDTTTGEPGQFISYDQASLGGDGPENRNGMVCVDCISLSQAFKRLGIEHVDLLKMDCEGAEYAILFNTPTEILKKVHRIVMEYHDDVTEYSHLDLARYLTDCGYKVETTTNFVHANLGYLFANRVD